MTNHWARICAILTLTFAGLYVGCGGTKHNVGPQGGRPAAPSNLAAAGQSASLVKVTWTDNANNEDTFIIERKVGASSFGQVGEIDKNVTEYLDTNVTAGMTYVYRVYAKNGYGWSDYSNEASAAAVAPSGLPLAPTNIVVPLLERGSNSLMLRWINASPGASVVIEMREEASSGFRVQTRFTQEQTVPPGTTSYQATRLSASTTYSFRMRARNNAGESGFVTTQPTRTLPPQAGSPGAPSLSATATRQGLTNQVTLNFQAASGYPTHEFRIYRRENTNPPPETFKLWATRPSSTTSFVDAGLPSTTTYQYFVRAFRTGYGESADSDVRQAITLSPSGDVPTVPHMNPADNITYKSVRVHWDWTVGANGQTPRGFVVQVEEGDQQCNPPQDGSQGSGGVRNVIVGGGPINPPPRILNWFTIPVEVGASDRECTIGPIDGDVSPTSCHYDLRILASDTTYAFRMWSVGVNGISDLSNVVCATLLQSPEGAPLAPINLQAVSGSNQVSLSWALPPASHPADGYDVYRRDCGGEFGEPVNGNQMIFTTSYTDNNGVQASHCYDYAVTATNEYGTSGLSVTLPGVLTNPPDPQAPAAITWGAVTRTRTTVTLNWTHDNLNVTGFNVHRQDPQAHRPHTVGYVAKANSSYTFTDTGLTAGAPYLYYIEAVNVGHGFSLATISEPLNVSTDPPDVSAPNPPTGLGSEIVSVTGNSAVVRFTWTDQSTNEEGFKLYQVGSTTVTTVPAVNVSGTLETVTTTISLSAGASYTHYVCAYRHDENQGYHESCSLAHDTHIQSASVPPAPSYLDGSWLSQNPPTIRLSWAYPGDQDLINGFAIQRCEVAAGQSNCSAWGNEQSIDKVSRIYDDHNLSTTVTGYKYQINAVNNAGGSAWVQTGLIPNPAYVRLNFYDGTTLLGTQENPSMDFGIVALTESRDKTVTVKNDGNDTLTLGTIPALAGRDFSIVSSTCNGTQLGHNATCSVNLHFAPVAPTGPKGSTLSIPFQSSSGNTSATLSLTGTADAEPTTLATFYVVIDDVEHEVSVDNPVDFSDVTIVTPPTTKTLTVRFKNRGTRSLRVTGTPFVTASTPFSVGTTDCTNGLHLANEAYCTIAVRFTPLAVSSSPYTSLLTVPATDDITQYAPPTAPLTGRGISGATAGNVIFNPDPVSFGSVVENETSAPVSVTITNNGGSTITFPSNALNIDNTMFSVIYGTGTTCSGTLVVNGTCTVSIRFQPTDVGHLIGHLTVSFNDGINPDPNAVTTRSVDLAGDGTPVYFGLCNSRGNPFGGGGGYSTSPYLICTTAQLDQVRNHLGSFFQMERDIDLTGVTFDTIGYSTPFSGSFNGNGHTISNLTVAVGLFGSVQNGTITNLALSGIYVNSGDIGIGSLAGRIVDTTVTNVHAVNVNIPMGGSTQCVGGLVGSMMGNSTISGSSVIGSVSSGGDDAGGLVACADHGTIDSSYSSTVVGTVGGNDAGGLVGRSEYTVIRKSVATGSVNAIGDYVGGLVGLAYYGSISDCRAIGPVSGGNSVGGLVGETGMITISNSYAAGYVHSIGTGGGITGGLVATSTSSTSTNSFWDINSSQTTTNALNMGVGKTTGQMGTPSTFSTWSPTIWSIVSGFYPKLVWEP